MNTFSIISIKMTNFYFTILNHLFYISYIFWITEVQFMSNVFFYF